MEMLAVVEGEAKKRALFLKKSAIFGRFSLVF